jgi:hypothetical protein
MKLSNVDVRNAIDRKLNTQGFRASDAGLPAGFGEQKFPIGVICYLMFSD